MRRFVAEHPRGKYGVHRYSLEEFGLERGELMERFAGYRAVLGLTEQGA